jgi:hypothetical protein
MLNDADGHGGGEAGEAVKDAEALFDRGRRQRVSGELRDFTVQ